MNTLGDIMAKSALRWDRGEQDSHGEREASEAVAQAKLKARPMAPTPERGGPHSRSCATGRR